MGDRHVTPVNRADDVTVAWCNEALAPLLDGATVTALATSPVGTGQVADTLRLRLTYDRPDAGPPTLIAKVPSTDDTSRGNARLTRTYELEASFYRQIAPDLPVRTPRCYHAQHDPASDAYVVLLEDVSPAEQGDQIAGCTVAEAEAAIDELALLHGPRWDDPILDEIPWLNRGQPENLDDLVVLVGMCVPAFLARYGERLDPATAGVVERLAPRLGAYLRDRPRPWTIVHGDYRVDNLLFGGERVVVVDWQTVGLGPGPADLSYLLGTSLVPAERRLRERELVARYVAGLRAQGVEVDDDAVWSGYRQFAYAGLIMAIAASALVVQTDRGDDMFLAMAERSATMALELDTESLVPAP